MAEDGGTGAPFIAKMRCGKASDKPNVAMRNGCRSSIRIPVSALQPEKIKRHYINMGFCNGILLLLYLVAAMSAHIPLTQWLLTTKQAAALAGRGPLMKRRRGSLSSLMTLSESISLNWHCQSCCCCSTGRLHAAS